MLTIFFILVNVWLLANIVGGISALASIGDTGGNLPLSIQEMESLLIFSCRSVIVCLDLSSVLLFFELCAF